MINTTEERYPLAISYNRARGGNITPAESLPPSYLWTAWIDGDMLFEACAKIRNFPTFCGGAILDSPYVNTYPLRNNPSSWAVALWPILNGSYHNACVPLENEEDARARVVDVNECGLKPAGTEAHEYAWRVLAHSVMCWMTIAGKRFVVFSGPEDHTTSDLAKAMSEVHSLNYHGVVFSPPSQQPFINKRVMRVSLPLRTEVTETPLRVNFNSGSLCRQYSVVVSNPMLGQYAADPECDDDEFREDALYVVDEYQFGCMDEYCSRIERMGGEQEDWFGDEMDKYPHLPELARRVVYTF